MKTTATLLAAVLAFSATTFAAPSPKDTEQTNGALDFEAAFCHNGFAAIDQEACQMECGGMARRAGGASSSHVAHPKRTGVPGPNASGRTSGTCAPAAGFTHPPLVVEAKWDKEDFKTGADGSITISRPVTTISAGPYYTCGGCPNPTARAETFKAHASAGAHPSRRV